MRSRLVSFVRIFVGMLMCAPLAGHAQRPTPTPIPVRNLAVCFLFAGDIPDFYYRNVQGEPTLLQIERERFTTWNEVPLGEELPLFRKETSEDGKPVYNPAATWRLPPGNNPVRILFYLKSSGKPAQMYIEDPPGRHAARQIRAINLTDTPVLASFNEEVVTLVPQQEQFIPAPADPNVRFKFQYGAKDTRGETRVSPVSNLRYRAENQRMTLIFGYQPEFDEAAPTRTLLGYKVGAMRIYDLIPAAAETKTP